MNQDFEYQYQGSSVVDISGKDKSFLLAHCSEIAQDNLVPCFFYGNIISSFLASKCLSVLGKTVRSHFAISPEQRINLRDPIVAVGNSELHFEGFSSCNGVYARLDILKEGIDGDFMQSGCTNVDFNDLSIRAFNTLSRTDQLIMGVGSESLDIITSKSKSKEKKVSLPDRWIKGLGNVQVYLSEMDLQFELNRIEALHLFRSLPKMPVKGDYFVYKSGNHYALSATAKPHSVKIGGIHRLNLLDNLLLLADSMSFYQAEDQQCAGVMLSFKDMQMLFLFSENVYRGFSAEGKNLEQLSPQVTDVWLTGINNYFKTNEIFQPTMVAIEHDFPFGHMNALQAALSSMGLLGYDLRSNQYFYRKLPFKLSRLKRLNPRLEGAIKLIDDDQVILFQNDHNGIRAEVKGSAGITHIVAGKAGRLQCTCIWFTNHQSNRGLCKHILALKMKLDALE